MRSESAARTREFIKHVQTTYPSKSAENVRIRKHVEEFIAKWAAKYALRPPFDATMEITYSFPHPSIVHDRQQIDASRLPSIAEGNVIDVVKVAKDVALAEGAGISTE